MKPKWLTDDFEYALIYTVLGFMMVVTLIVFGITLWIAIQVSTH